MLGSDGNLGNIPASGRGCAVHEMQRAACLVLQDGGKSCKGKDRSGRASTGVMIPLFWLLYGDLVFCTHMVRRSLSVVQAGDLFLGQANAY